MEDEELRGLPPAGDDLPAMEGSGEMASCDSGSSLGQSSLSQQLTNSGSEVYIHTQLILYHNSGQ